MIDPLFCRSGVCLCFKNLWLWRACRKNRETPKKAVTTSHPHFHSCASTSSHEHTRLHTHARQHEMMYSSLSSSSSVLAMTNSTTTKTTPFASTRRVKAAAQKWAKNTKAAPSSKRSNPTTTRARASAFEMGGGGLKRKSVRLNAMDTEAPSSSNKIETPFGTIDLPQLPELPKFELPNASSSSSSSSSSQQQDAIAQIARQFAKTMEDSIPKDVQKNVFRAQYTAAVSARFLFFLTNGVVASRGGSRADVDGVGVASAVAKILLEENNIDTKPFEDTIRPMVRAADANLTTAGNSPEKESEGMTEEAARDVSAFLEAHMSAILSVFREEMELIENEEYKFPYDMNPVTAPSYQTNLLQVLRISRDNIRDQQQKVQPRRQRKDGGQDLLSTFEIDEKRYPKYYAQNFHYQTDGWLSNESARLYDFQVETLFLGSADAMRRRCLPHLNKYLKSQKKNAKLLDVATGTGRFLTFVRDNNPELECTAQDLSPFYLAKTRDNHKAFDKNGGKLTLLEANAEDMSTLEDGSFDAVTCVYLFHELPPEAQKNVVKEMSRVLKPGGKLFFVDSAQRGDGKRMNMEKEIDQALENFPVFSHEPYYRAYSELDLKNLFKEVGGLDCEAEELAWVSKTLVFQKPGGDESLAMNGASVTELRDDDEDVDESVLAAANELKAEMRNSTVAPVVEEMEQKPAVEEITWAGEASTKEIFEQVTPEVIEEKEDEQN